MDSSAYKSLDWLGTGVLDSICLEMDKERLIRDKDYELIFLQKDPVWNSLNKISFECVFGSLFGIVQTTKPGMRARCSLTINRLTLDILVFNYC